MNNRLAARDKSDRYGYAEVSAISKVSSATPPRWRCGHHTYGSDIEAYVTTQDSLEVIAEVRQFAGVSARINAELIVHAVNEHEKYEPLIHELVETLEFYLAEDPVSNAALKQEAEFLCRKARRIVVRKV